jgi:hypothetical protein
MGNKRYLDKVIEHLVRRTKVDNDKGEIILPFTTNATPFGLSAFIYFYRSTPFSLPFVKYCNKQFGLTEEEIKYVYYKYVNIIEDKI